MKKILALLLLVSNVALADAPVIWNGSTAKWLPSGLKSAGVCKLDALGVMTSSTVSLVSNVSGVLPVLSGGTGQSSYVDGEILIGRSSDNSLSKATLTAGTGITVTNGNGSITLSASSSSGVTTVGTIDSQAKSADGLVISGANIYAQTADPGFPGVLSTGTQTIAGVKTFSSAPNLSSLTALRPLKLDALNNVISTLINLASSNDITGVLPTLSGGTGQSSYTDGQILIGKSSDNSLSKATITAGTNVTVTNGDGSITIAATDTGITQLTGDVTAGPGSGSQVATIANLAVTNAKIASNTIDLPSKVTGVLPTLSGGTGQSSYTNGQILIGKSSDNSLSKATLTAGSGITITNGDGSITLSASSSAGEFISKDVTQANSFVVGDVVRLSGSTYIKSQADQESNSEVYGLVSAATGSDFTLLMVGRLTGLSGLVSGTTYYLSQSTAGTITAVEPTATGQVSKPVLLADSTTSGFVIQSRGAVIGSGGGGGSATEWTAYTPTINGVGAPTDVNYFYRTVGDTLYVKGTHVNGTVAASLFQVSLPSGFTIDTTKIERVNDTTTHGPLVGNMTTNNANEYIMMITATTTSTTIVYGGLGATQSGKLTPSNGNASLNTGSFVSMNFSVPVN